MGRRQQSYKKIDILLLGELTDLLGCKYLYVYNDTVVYKFPSQVCTVLAVLMESPTICNVHTCMYCMYCTVYMRKQGTSSIIVSGYT